MGAAILLFGIIFGAGVGFVFGVLGESYSQKKKLEENQENA